MNASDAPTEEQGGEPPVRYVLFVCNHNAGRSQMAQAFFERYGPEGVRAESAGTEPAPEIWPPVVEAMREVGFDLAERTPKTLTVEMQQRATWAVTMGCGDACPYVPTIVEAWDIPDPAGRAMEEVRAIRDQIQRQVRELIAVRIDAGD
ncbi:MAG TPA: arsenate reductase ArsC [Solirubrobacteraceae bacterium]|jgi:arsenate reductase|nr:arsenate reductase ArsC [Solirubrobacteraceae bacterium]